MDIHGHRYTAAERSRSDSGQSLVLPSIPEATDALVAMFAGSGLPRPSKLKLGTCIAAVEATYPGQVACTMAVTLRAATTESQIDFYKQGKKWVGQPSVSQDKLPFPDPALH
ncbi:hypothetical protein [Comamonas sp. Y33R10-2]|uniref:hypothetical protein n=1 Tax=Comamonas sp. Y33R10-2 TaxID=2853257 RepID=UPI002103007C|nr:hypothetical protein [Comamonas sp. Y33R10-2]